MKSALLPGSVRIARAQKVRNVRSYNVVYVLLVRKCAKNAPEGHLRMRAETWYMKNNYE